MLKISELTSSNFSGSTYSSPVPVVQCARFVAEGSHITWPYNVPGCGNDVVWTYREEAGFFREMIGRLPCEITCRVQRKRKRETCFLNDLTKYHSIQFTVGIFVLWLPLCTWREPCWGSQFSSRKTVFAKRSAWTPVTGNAITCSLAILFEASWPVLFNKENEKA